MWSNSALNGDRPVPVEVEMRYHGKCLESQYQNTMDTLEMVQFMSDMSGLETRSLGRNTLGIAESPASSQYVLVNNSSWKIAMGPRFKVSSERLEKPLIEPTTPGLHGE